MTNEKRYEALVNMIRAFDEAADMTLGEEVIKNPNIWDGSPNCIPGAAGAFYGWAASLLMEAKTGMDKKTTPSARLSAVNRIYKSACGQVRDSLYGAFQSGGKWAICDGYRFVRLNSKPESIPEVTGGIDLDRCIPAEAASAEPVELPAASEIKAHIAANKYKLGRSTMVHPMEAVSGWWCDPRALLDIIQALPDAVAHLPKNRTSAMYFTCENGEDAMLLPVRH